MLVRWLETGKAFAAAFKWQRSVTEPIASDMWTFKGPKGRRQTAEIGVGRPLQAADDKNADWFCPAFIERSTAHVIPAMGVFIGKSRGDADKFHVLGGTPFLITPYRSFAR